jgi:hypothetical protein
MIIKIQPDAQKSRALKKMAEVTLERIQDTDLTKYPSNILVDYHDVIHKLLEAATSLEGIKIKGEGAHEELIDFVASNYGLDEQTRQLIRQMRDYRNRISYEGLMINKNYILLNEKKIKEIIEGLFNKLSMPGESKGKA